MNHFKHIFSNFELDQLDFSSAVNSMRASHWIMIHNKQIAFKCEILHGLSRKWSGIRILEANDESRLMASSYFIGISQLPNQSVLSYLDKKINPIRDCSNHPGVSLEKFEKAMLVRNLNGDYAIIKGMSVYI